MKTKIQKWGNSLAVRIPKALAQEAELRDNSRVEIQVENEALVIIPVRRKPSLRTLLEAVTPENLHDEITTGEPVGREVW